MSMHRNRRQAPMRRQRGVALFIALVVLLIITVLGVSGLQTTTMQERMAASARDRDIAFQAAEAALIRAEVLIETFSPTSLASFDGTDGRYDYPEVNASTPPPDPPYWEQVDWDGDANIPMIDVTIAGVATQPKYIIEYMATLTSADDDLNISNLGTPIGAPTEIFRITAYGTGGSDIAHVMLQSTYGRIIQ